MNNTEFRELLMNEVKERYIDLENNKGKVFWVVKSFFPPKSVLESLSRSKNSDDSLKLNHIFDKFSFSLKKGERFWESDLKNYFGVIEGEVVSNKFCIHYFIN